MNVPYWFFYRFNIGVQYIYALLQLPIFYSFSVNLSTFCNFLLSIAVSFQSLLTTINLPMQRKIALAQAQLKKEREIEIKRYVKRVCDRKVTEIKYITSMYFVRANYWGRSHHLGHCKRCNLFLIWFVYKLNLIGSSLFKRLWKRTIFFHLFCQIVIARTSLVSFYSVSLCVRVRHWAIHYSIMYESFFSVYHLSNHCCCSFCTAH